MEEFTVSWAESALYRAEKPLKTERKQNLLLSRPSSRFLSQNYYWQISLMTVPRAAG